MSQFGRTAYRRPAITATNSSTVEVSGLRFASPVYFAEVDRSTKVFKEKCARCLELLVEAAPAPNPVKGGAAEKGLTVRKGITEKKM